MLLAGLSPSVEENILKVWMGFAPTTRPKISKFLDFEIAYRCHVICSGVVCLRRMLKVETCAYILRTMISQSTVEHTCSCLEIQAVVIVSPRRGSSLTPTSTNRLRHLLILRGGRQAAASVCDLVTHSGRTIWSLRGLCWSGRELREMSSIYQRTESSH